MTMSKKELIDKVADEFVTQLKSGDYFNRKRSTEVLTNVANGMDLTTRLFDDVYVDSDLAQELYRQVVTSGKPLIDLIAPIARSIAEKILDPSSRKLEQSIQKSLNQRYQAIQQGLNSRDSDVDANNVNQDIVSSDEDPPFAQNDNYPDRLLQSIFSSITAMVTQGLHQHQHVTYSDYFAQKAANDLAIKNGADPKDASLHLETPEALDLEMRNFSTKFSLPMDNTYGRELTSDNFFAPKPQYNWIQAIYRGFLALITYLTSKREVEVPFEAQLDALSIATEEIEKEIQTFSDNNKDLEVDDEVKQVLKGLKKFKEGIVNVWGTLDDKKKMAPLTPTDYATAKADYQNFLNNFVEMEKQIFGSSQIITEEGATATPPSIDSILANLPSRLKHKETKIPLTPPNISTYEALSQDSDHSPDSETDSDEYTPRGPGGGMR